MAQVRQQAGPRRSAPRRRQAGGPKQKPAWKAEIVRNPAGSGVRDASGRHVSTQSAREDPTPWLGVGLRRRDGSATPRPHQPPPRAIPGLGLTQPQGSGNERLRPLRGRWKLPSEVPGARGLPTALAVHSPRCFCARDSQLRASKRCPAEAAPPEAPLRFPRRRVRPADAASRSLRALRAGKRFRGGCFL